MAEDSDYNWDWNTAGGYDYAGDSPSAGPSDTGASEGGQWAYDQGVAGNFDEASAMATDAAYADAIRPIRFKATLPMHRPPPPRNIPQQVLSREADNRQKAISAGYIGRDGIADLRAYFKNIADKEELSKEEPPKAGWLDRLKDMGPDMVWLPEEKEPPSPVQFFYQQFRDKPMTPEEAKKALGERTINELNKVIARNQAVSKDGPGLVKDVPFKPEGEVTWETPGYQQNFGGISNLFSDNPFFNLQNTLGQFYYGPAGLSGEREVYDLYNWHKGDAEGLRGALERRDLKWFAETAAKEYQEFTGREGHPISFTVNPYEDQWKFNPETGEYIYPEGMGQGLYPWRPARPGS